MSDTHSRCSHPLADSDFAGDKKIYPVWVLHPGSMPGWGMMNHPGKSAGENSHDFFLKGYRGNRISPLGNCIMAQERMDLFRQ